MPPSQNFSRAIVGLVWWIFIKLAARRRSLLAFVKEYGKDISSDSMTGDVS